MEEKFVIEKYVCSLVFERENISRASIQAFKTVLDLLQKSGLIQHVSCIDVHGNLIEVNLMDLLDVCYRFDCRTGDVESACSIRSLK